MCSGLCCAAAGDPNDPILDLLHADVLQREWERVKVGDHDHPLNVAKIRERLGCIDDLCEVELRYPLFGYEAIEILHQTPAHEREYRILNHWGDRTGKIVRQTFPRSLNASISADPYLLSRRGREETEEMARYLIEKLKYQLNKAWPHHA